jgi:hypothetical protein
MQEEIQDNIISSPKSTAETSITLMSKFNNLISEYKLYIFIGIAVIIIAYIGYTYYYKKKVSLVEKLEHEEPEVPIIPKHKVTPKCGEKPEPISEESELNISDDINKEIAKIKAEEHINVSCHNLTTSEIDDINTKLNMIPK